MDFGLLNEVREEKMSFDEVKNASTVSSYAGTKS